MGTEEKLYKKIQQAAENNTAKRNAWCMKLWRQNSIACVNGI